MFCLLYDIPLIRVDENNLDVANYVPCSSVEWCSKILGYNVKPNYYPDWLKKYLYRNVWETNKWPLGKKVFIKPADKYKRFNGFITTGIYSKKKKSPFWCSDIVYFKNEWRYYISNGKILCSGWYLGDEINIPEVPILNINIPKDYCGAVDFGELKTGKLALVETNHPFACGWYGKQSEDYLYFQWLVNGWKYMQNLKITNK